MVLDDSRAKEFTSGLLSAAVSITLTYPLTKLIFRQILENSSMKSSYSRMRKEGFWIMYRGILPPLFQRSTEISLMFGVYKTAELALHPLKLSMVDEMVASSTISGIVESALTPFERTQLLLINSVYNHKFRNMLDAFYVQVKEFGPKELYRGYTTILIRNICHNTFFFLAKDQMQGIMKCHRRKHMIIGMENFLIGATIGMAMTGLFYPLKVIKANTQKRLGGKHISPLEAAREVHAIQGRGVRNFYRGVGLNVIRAMLAWGFTNFSYEFIRNRI